MDGEKAEKAVGEEERGRHNSKQNSLELELEKDQLKSFQKSFNVSNPLPIPSAPL
jgi:hypothetical protein